MLGTCVQRQSTDWRSAAGEPSCLGERLTLGTTPEHRHPSGHGTELVLLLQAGWSQATNVYEQRHRRAYTATKPSLGNFTSKHSVTWRSRAGGGSGSSQTRPAHHRQALTEPAP
ncbi:hypothetical protein E2C01_008300 [Portunus trituberculatus]|uniref:Uncharacterized protein n=1 Tax=Portunus trituberculatus TaxID=210409 RepID=A0A5B7D0F8_PORTR|nr:hypothetical protein [Portunus trituberculatus]